MPNRLRSWSQPSTQPGTDQLRGPNVGISLQSLGLEQIDRGSRRRAAAGIQADRASWSWHPRRSRTGRRRARTTSARPRPARRWPRSPHRRRCPLAASTRMAVAVASGWLVAAIPWRAITAERVLCSGPARPVAGHGARGRLPRPSQVRQAKRRSRQSTRRFRVDWPSTMFLQHRVSQVRLRLIACRRLRRQLVDRVAKRQGRLAPGWVTASAAAALAHGGGLVERSPLRQRDGQRTVERIAGADGVDRLDPRRRELTRCSPRDRPGSRALPA